MVNQIAGFIDKFQYNLYYHPANNTNALFENCGSGKVFIFHRKSRLGPSDFFDDLKGGQ